MERPLKHLLLVEDHAQTRAAVIRALNPLGFAVYARESVEEAIVREGEYKQLDMAVLDVVLPGQRGDEYAANLRKRFPRLPIIFFTADLDTQRISELVPDSQIISKPVNVEGLLNSIIY